MPKLLELRSKEERTREQAALIRQGAEHLNTLLTEILDLAKIEAGAMTAYLEPVELRPLLVEATQSVLTPAQRPRGWHWCSTAVRFSRAPC